MNKQIIKLQLELPDNYNRKDFLAFHNRDKQEIAEQRLPSGFRKGLIWEGFPACLEVKLGTKKAHLSLHVDGAESSPDKLKLEQVCRHLLGIDQPAIQFEQEYSAHPAIGHLVRENAGMRIPQCVFPYEAIIWAIIGQLISLEAAISIRRRFILATGRQHSSGIWCFPDAASVALASMDDLRAAGLSGTKAATLVALSKQVACAKCNLDAWMSKLAKNKIDVEKIRSKLLAIKGVGPWTVSYALLRGFAYLDGSLHGDIAVRRNLARLLKTEQRPSEKETEKWLEPFSPWRALVASHLWALEKESGY